MAVRRDRTPARKLHWDQAVARYCKSGGTTKGGCPLLTAFGCLLALVQDNAELVADLAEEDAELADDEA